MTKTKFDLLIYWIYVPDYLYDFCDHNQKRITLIPISESS